MCKAEAIRADAHTSVGLLPDDGEPEVVRKLHASEPDSREVPQKSGYGKFRDTSPKPVSGQCDRRMLLGVLCQGQILGCERRSLEKGHQGNETEGPA
jgi:hypothetical protein